MMDKKYLNLQKKRNINYLIKRIMEDIDYLIKRIMEDIDYLIKRMCHFQLYQTIVGIKK